MSCLAGCHLYAISRPGGSHIRLVVAVGKKLQVFMWKHSSAWSAWCPISDNETVDGFQFLRVSGFLYSDFRAIANLQSDLAVDAYNQCTISNNNI